MIDEVQLEQDASPLPLKPVDSDEFQGFIGKYTRKVTNANDAQPEEEQPDPDPTPAKKSMAERFEEKIAQDQ